MSASSPHPPPPAALALATPHQALPPAAASAGVRPRLHRRHPGLRGSASYGGASWETARVPKWCRKFLGFVFRGVMIIIMPIWSYLFFCENILKCHVWESAPWQCQFLVLSIVSSFKQISCRCSLHNNGKRNSNPKLHIKTHRGANPEWAPYVASPWRVAWQQDNLW